MASGIKRNCSGGTIERRTSCGGAKVRGMRAEAMRAPVCVAEALEPRVLLAGITILVHGHDTSAETTWVKSMADQIAAAAGGTDKVSQYKMVVDDNSGSIAVTSFAPVAGSALRDSQSNSTGESILRIDWSDLAKGWGIWPVPDPVSTVAVADVVADYLLGPAKWTVETPIHLIGHSRGASLNTRLAQRLGQRGIWVDQFTSLDPHPVDGIGDVESWGDQEMHIWQNVVFADNYWRSDGDLTDMDGEPVSGAHNVRLDDAVLGQVTGTGHNDVHLWYHGTIGPPYTDTDGAATIGLSWYLDPYPDRSNSGFTFSGILGGTRPSAGGWTACRAGLTRDADPQWPNIGQITLASSLTNYVIGIDTVNVAYIYRDHDSSTVTSFYFDSDSNPYNGLGANVHNLNKGLATCNVPIDVNVPTGGVSPGTYYLAAKVTDGGRTRYAYLHGTVNLIDKTPPTPNPTTWATKPYPTGTTSIRMVATTSSDPNGLEYFFDCLTTGGHDSGWQASPIYVDTGLGAGLGYSYRVSTRDLSTAHNQTGWSSTELGTTSQVPVADLTWNTISGTPATRKPGESITISWNYEVVGQAITPNFSLRAVLSTNQTFGDADDIVLGDRWFNNASDKSVSPPAHTGSQAFNVPGSIAAGSYWLIGKLDATDTVTEANPNNNVLVGNRITISAPGTVPGSISGTVFHDANANRAKGSGEGPLVTTLFVDVDNDGVKEAGEPWTTSSPRTGKYALLSVSPGTFSVRAIAPPGFRQTAPRRPPNHSVTVSSGQAVDNVNFGFTSLAYVCGTVWNDANANRAIDNGEGRLQGWRVFIDANNDGKWQTTESSVLTDSGGYFIFNLAPGTYTLRIVAQSGWSATSRVSQIVTLSSGQVIDRKLGFGQRPS